MKAKQLLAALAKMNDEDEVCFMVWGARGPTYYRPSFCQLANGELAGFPKPVSSGGINYIPIMHADNCLAHRLDID